MPPGNLKDVNWGLFLTTIIWSTGGFDNLSQVAGELKNPNKSYPRAMVIVLIAMIVTVIAPVMVAVSVATDYSKWTDGYFSVVATMLGGEWLHIVMVIGACVSSLGVLNAYLCTCSEMLAAWGEKDLLSLKFLQAQSRWKTPYVALLINSFLIAIGTILPFEFLVQMDQLYYSIGLGIFPCFGLWVVTCVSGACWANLGFFFM
jgi:amino acid transporter